MIYALYLALAAGVVLLSKKASEYVDLLDKTTKLSGAFIGGVLLSAVTSLPELFTSISATLMLDKPGLCTGNILGSNLFNIAVLSILILIWYRSFLANKIAGSHTIVVLCVLLMYTVLVLNMFKIIDQTIFSLSVTSLLIIAIYIVGVRFMAVEDGSDSQVGEVHTKLTLKQIVIRFIMVSVGLVILSIAITYVTDIISVKLNLGAGLAGALFLGVATSLPEVSSTVALFRMRSFNIAIGNIIGSNMFNFIIFSIADIVYVKGSVYDYSDPKNVYLLVFGLAAMFLSLIVMKWKNKVTQIICPVCIIACYGLFLTL